MKKIVLIGGPCSGKTTLVNLLRKKGYNTLGESAREVLEERKQYNADENELVLIRENLIFKKQIQREIEIQNKNGCVFLDRGIYDPVVYLKYFLGRDLGLKVPDTFEKYSGVFCLDRLPFVNDGLRAESGENEAEKLHNLIKQKYVDEGYLLMRVPILSVEKRLDFILKNSR